MPPEIRDWIGRLRDQGRTLDEIVAHLRTLDADAVPSRSAVHRHLQRAEVVAERMKQSRAVADVIMRRLGEGEPDRATRMNIELMHSVIFDMASRIGEDGGEGEAVTLQPMEVMMMAKALDHLGKAAKDDVARTVTIEKRAAEKAKAEAVKAAAQAIGEAEATGGPLDGAALLKKIREDVYGLRS